MSLLEVKNLKKIYRTRFSNQQVQALSNVTFRVEEGEYVAIMGESGSGKTTLLNILASLDKPTSGQVFLQGQDITLLKEKEGFPARSGYYTVKRKGNLTVSSSESGICLSGFQFARYLFCQR